MELTTAIEHILDGNALIIMGSGASAGAKNAYDEFPSGKTLAKHLYEMCAMVPDDETDLQDAAQLYEDKFSSADLIQEINMCILSPLPFHNIQPALDALLYYKL